MQLYSNPSKQPHHPTPSHTPGPWCVNTKGFICDSTNAIVTRMEGSEESGNARLIAAAPGLLAALENARLDLDYIAASLARKNTISISSVQNCAARARQAIAMAKGEVAS